MKASFQEYLKTLILARFPLIQLLTWEEERALAELLSIAKTLNKGLRVWSCTRGLYSPHLGRAQKEELLDPMACLNHILEADANSLFVLLDFHAFFQNNQILRRLREAVFQLKTSKKNIILLGPVETIPVELLKEMTSVDFPLPNFEQITEALNAIGANLGAKGQLVLSAKEREDLVKSAQGLTLNEIENVLAISVLQKKRIDRETIALVLEEKKQIIRKSGILEYVGVEIGLESVGGYRCLKEWVRKRGQAFSNRAQKFGIPTPKGLFLLGIQGCGKSLLAKTIAQSWQLPLLRMDVGRIFSGIVGSSELNIRRAIQLAESLSPCVLWIDEIEKAFAGVGSSNVSDAGTAARVLATFMTWLQEKKTPVFLVATANDLASLPSEFIRKGRFDEVFFLDLPNSQERKEVFSIHLRHLNREVRDFDLDKLSVASKGFSGAEIEQAIMDALYEPFEENRPLQTQDILNQLAQTYPLSRTMQEPLSRLRLWAQNRTRMASDEIEVSL